ncbi:hypothetical protein SH668x_003447 [Planctomicrobium sp. SH668]|uniref:hypothetical protein n=1 Tax=Planctomicrobium sp. SH668 TaxID=3448126 RepID=UPI003F5B1497
MAELSSMNVPTWFYGEGTSPKLDWNYKSPSPLTCVEHSREAGDFYCADETGKLTVLDSAGRKVLDQQFDQPIVALSWSDDGSQGAAILGENRVVRLNQHLQVEMELKFHDVCRSVAVSPFGNHLAVGLADSKTFIYAGKKKPVATFESVRPLSFLKFCPEEPILFGAADHGLVCCFNLRGVLIWQHPNRSNVARISVCGDGHVLFIAGFLHGIQALDGDGNALGTYVLDGTVNRIDSSYDPDRIIASTVEREIEWLDKEGTVLWKSQVPNDVIEVICDPLGEWAVCAFKNEGLYSMKWSRITEKKSL